MPKSYVTPTLADIHEMMSDLHDARVIDKKTMREFDESCLTPIVDMTPQAIQQLRQREQASQTVFARYLNVPVSLVSQWERGEKHPNGPSLKLLSLVKKKGLQAVA
jgi:putative transcriptional regulator